MSEKGDGAGEVHCESSEEILASNNLDGHNSANMRDNQKERVLVVVVQSSELIKSNLQRRRFRAFDVGACFFDMLALQVGP